MVKDLPAALLRVRREGLLRQPFLPYKTRFRDMDLPTNKLKNQVYFV